MRRVVLFASVVVAVVLFVGLFFWAFQRRLIYLPSTGAVPPAATMLADARDVQLTTSDGLRLVGWYLPACRQADTFTVLVANGNAGARNAELATEHPPAGLVLRSPFTDLASVGQIHYPFLPVRALLKDRFRVAEYLARVAVPITVVYGTEDSIVPPEESRRSIAAARGPTHLVAVEGADHNDPALLNGHVLVQAVMDQAYGSGGT